MKPLAIKSGAKFMTRENWSGGAWVGKLVLPVQTLSPNTARKHAGCRLRLLCAGLLGLLAGLPICATAWAAETEIEEIALWDNKTGPHLRGSTISQRRFYPEIDDLASLGPGPSGPPHRQKDFDDLAAAGANVVMISHPAPFAEAPPYGLEPATDASLDRLVAMAARADLFVVLTFRTGPGRSEFGFFAKSAGTWFDADLVNDEIWASQAAQDAWVDLWRHVAARYRDHPTVIGYELMVEPNSNAVGSNAITNRLNIHDPREFDARYGGTLYDWNQLHPRITAAIREVDPDTPVLIPGNGYSDINFLPFTKDTGDPASVHVIHQYEPWRYTSQAIDKPRRYPGRFDVDWDDRPDPVDRALLERIYRPVDAFRRARGVSVAVTEFGLVRWAPGAAAFLRDHMEAMEARGINHLFYFWDPSFPAYRYQLNPYNFRFGPDPDNRVPTSENPLLETAKLFWARNRLRPSNVRLERRGAQ